MHDKTTENTAVSLAAKLPTLDMQWPDEIRDAWFHAIRCVVEHARGRVSGESEWRSWMGELEYQSWH